MLVCAMNPCKCGWYGHPSGTCTCSGTAVEKYRERLSGPLLDRIDMIVEVSSLEYSELRGKAAAESSADIRRRVNAARSLQRGRYAGTGADCNAQIGAALLEAHCELSPDCERLMRLAFERMNLTARSYDRILRVARTISDLGGEKDIQPAALAEAIQYRTYDFGK
jgi:magnesium chelatase family protein